MFIHKSDQFVADSCTIVWDYNLLCCPSPLFALGFEFEPGEVNKLYSMAIQVFVLVNRAIHLAADEAGFSCIANVQYEMFIALRSCDRDEFQTTKLSKSLPSTQIE